VVVAMAMAMAITTNDIFINGDEGSGEMSE